MQTKTENTVTPASIARKLPPPGDQTQLGYSTPKLDFPNLNVTDPNATPIDQFFEEGYDSQHLNLNFEPLQQMTAVTPTLNSARSIHSSSLPSVNKLGEVGDMKSLKQQTQALSFPPWNDNMVLAPSETPSGQSSATSYGSLQNQGANNNQSSSSLSSDDPLPPCDREL